MSRNIRVEWNPELEKLQLISEKHGVVHQDLDSNRRFKTSLALPNSRSSQGEIRGRTGRLLDATTGEDYSETYSETFVYDGVYFKYDMFDEGFKLENCNLPNADFLGVIWEYVQFSKVDFTNADFRYADMPCIWFKECNLTGAKFIGANCTGVHFINADLTNANFTDADLASANFTDANLTNADFMGADLTNADFTGANLTGTIFSDKRGFQNGIHSNGTPYDDRGFNINKVHQNGTLYDDQGFDFDGYNAQGYNRHGYGRDGFNQQGYNLQGYGRDGFDRLGYTSSGYGRDGKRYRVIRRNVPVYNRYEDDEYAIAVQKLLESRGVPRAKYCGYFFPDNTHVHVVYAGDTPNLEDAIARLEGEGYSLLH